MPATPSVSPSDVNLCVRACRCSRSPRVPRRVPSSWAFSGDDGTRTHDFLLAKQKVDPLHVGRSANFGGLGVGRRSERFGATATSCGHDHQAAQTDQDHRHSTNGDDTGSSRTRDGGSAARLDFLKDPGQLIEWPGHRPRLGVRWRDGGCRRCSGRRRRCRPWRRRRWRRGRWSPWSVGGGVVVVASLVWSQAAASWWSVGWVVAGGSVVVVVGSVVAGGRWSWWWSVAGGRRRAASWSWSTAR